MLFDLILIDEVLLFFRNSKRLVCSVCKTSPWSIPFSPKQSLYRTHNGVTRGFAVIESFVSTLIFKFFQRFYASNIGTLKLSFSLRKDFGNFKHRGNCWIKKLMQAHYMQRSRYCFYVIN
ncbi:hypothetical protein BD560DRAFT_427247 [Blakeslea trispora]|nr:hypothetical protein BD560DRAFT_427247 [Blakeslea trispora]